MSFAPRARIDLDALRHNLNRVRSAAPRSRVMAVVKANAYGHGLVRVARALDKADALAVARVGEAGTLRRAGLQSRGRNRLDWGAMTVKTPQELGTWITVVLDAEEIRVRCLSESGRVELDLVPENRLSDLILI